MLRDETIQRVIRFRDDRDWRQFHTPKDLAISLTLEAAELLEVFQWSGTDLECGTSWTGSGRSWRTCSATVS